MLFFFILDYFYVVFILQLKRDSLDFSVDIKEQKYVYLSMNISRRIILEDCLGR